MMKRLATIAAIAALALTGCCGDKGKDQGKSNAPPASGTTGFGDQQFAR